jgi:hypothetical protein
MTVTAAFASCSTLIDLSLAERLLRVSEVTMVGLCAVLQLSPLYIYRFNPKRETAFE